MFNIGATYGTLEHFDEAQPILKDCYDRRCIVLGKDHVDTLSCAECIDSISKCQLKQIIES